MIERKEEAEDRSVVGAAADFEMAGVAVDDVFGYP